MTDREIFKRNLSDLIHSTKVRQIDIAKYAEVSYQTVSAWVQGRGYPRADAMQKLCRFFNVKQSVLTEDHTSEETQEDILLRNYRKLSDEGKEKLLERSCELAKLYPRRKRKNAETEAEI